MKIGIFDSGIGGLSVLYEAMQLLPHEQFIYYADEKHVPYGEKTREEIIGYVDEIIQFMIDHDCKAIVIACNTATSAAVALMRKKYDIPIIGMEPAVKKAVDLFLQKNLNGCYKMNNQKEVQLYQEDPLSDFVYTNQAYHDILEYIKYVSDEDHLKHIPDYLPVYLLSGGFDNLTKNGKDTIKLYQILKGNGLKDLQYKIYDNKRQDILHDNNYRDVYHDIMHWLDERTYI